MMKGIEKKQEAQLGIAERQRVSYARLSRLAH